MIRTLIGALALTTSISSAAMADSLPQNIVLQRESMHSFTLLLQMQAEGLQRRELNDFQQSLQSLERAAPQKDKEGATDNLPLAQHIKNLVDMIENLQTGQVPSTHDLSEAYLVLNQTLEQLNNSEQDKRYASILINSYLAMRYVYKSHVGLAPQTNNRSQSYYTTHLSDLVIILDQEINSIASENQNTDINPRWHMLKMSYSDMQQGWTRTVSGNPYTPTIVRLNSSVLSRQLESQILKTHKE
ncbi:hypothetical protein ACFSB1_10235 [Halopseudomonas phragmitis]|uniref:Uncharacterized protein n=1 Tax=Halopseudomonas phragmitis TaxID=1931241 RepID=A0A1V0B960_9GAMM|nr:hypothetical protein [Halopseudomonas phragmitis]AQZ96473.1 hypothetical protein BVH74_17690 [Halopseudomonas phragmitis]